MNCSDVLDDRAPVPLYQENMDSFSSLVTSIEGYNYAVVFVDCNSGYRWVYGIKLKSDMLKVVKKWFCDIANLRQKHKLVIAMRDNAGEYKSQEIIDFFESVGQSGVSALHMSNGRMDSPNPQSDDQFNHDGRKDNVAWRNLDLAVDSDSGQHKRHVMLAMRPTRSASALLLGGRCIMRC